MTSIRKFQAPIVGQRYRPPAVAVCNQLAFRQGWPLTLQREPDNPYDANAVKVIVEVDPANSETDADRKFCNTVRELAREDMEERGQPYPEGEVPTSFWIGYIAKEDAAVITHWLDNGWTAKATVALNFKGQVSADVTILLPEQAEDSPSAA